MANELTMCFNKLYPIHWNDMQMLPFNKLYIQYTEMIYKHYGLINYIECS